MLKYLLDTDTVIHAIRHRPDAVRAAFKRHEGQLALSTVSLGELSYGAERSSRPEQNLAVIDGLAARLEVLPFESADAAQWGQIRAELARAGTSLGAYELMLAGQARARGLILVTNNTREFKRVPGLRLANWVK